MKAKLKRKKTKRFFGAYFKTRDRWPKRLGLVRATARAEVDRAEVDVIGAQLCGSLARAIFPCVALFRQDCSFLQKIVDYCQTQKRSTI